MSDLKVYVFERSSERGLFIASEAPDISDSDFVLLKDVEAKIAELQTVVDRLELLSFMAYCQGYGKGHNDTVENCYSPPEEYPEEWEEIRQELMQHSTGDK